MITGTFKSSPSDVMELLANIPLVQLQLADTCYREALWLCSLPSSHPLHSHVLRAARHPPWFHRSLIHTMLQSLALDPASVKTISPIRQHPSWQPLVTMHIAANKKEALSAVHTRIDDIRVFTDGSGINDLIGAAAVTYDNDHSWSLSYGLGPISQHTVFEGELVGVILALELLRTVLADTTTVMIALDNQATISAVATMPGNRGSTCSTKSTPSFGPCGGLTDTCEFTWNGSWAIQA